MSNIFTFNVVTFRKLFRTYFSLEFPCVECDNVAGLVKSACLVIHYFTAFYTNLVLLFIEKITNEKNGRGAGA